MNVRVAEMKRDLEEERTQNELLLEKYQQANMEVYTVPCAILVSVVIVFSLH